jgi:hypothetical protein
LGISHKRFTGWEPRTVYEYDAQGRLAASTLEVEWDEEQRDLMIALQEYRASLCPLCGWRREICGNSKNSHLIEIPTPERCYVATNLEVAKDRETANGAVVQQPSARLWGARLKVT